MAAAEPPPRHTGPRGQAAPAHIARSFKRVQRQVDDLASIRKPQELHAVDSDVTTGKPCTAGAFASLQRFWVYRNGANVYTDVAVGCGTASVVQARLTCTDFTLTGEPVASAAGGEHVLRLSLAMPDAWQSGDAHYVYVQGFRSSGTDATTLQVVRGWQR